MESLRRVIRREGPISFSRFMEVALYEPGEGFFATGHGAGRAGRDFVTSPEVGPLFGACVARALDGWWADLGHPDPFLVVEAGAGNGRLAREILRAEPACGAALHYLLVERSAHLRDSQRELLTLEPPDEVLGAFLPGDEDEPAAPAPGRGPIVAALADLPADVAGVVLANELLDNLPFDIVEFDGAEWHEVLVGLDGGAFSEVQVPSRVAPIANAAAGVRVPVPNGVDTWLAECGTMLRRGILAIVDYVEPYATLAARSPDWLRTYREHAAGSTPIDRPGTQDITADVPVEALLDSARGHGFVVRSDQSQSEWLHSLGIDDLVAEGQRVWKERAHLGDLEAIAGRSRGVEAAALTAEPGLGAHRLLVFDKHA